MRILRLQAAAAVLLAAPGMQDAASEPTPAPLAAPRVQEPSAETTPVRTPVGVKATVYGVVLPGSEFEPVELDNKAPVALRIEHVQRHGTAHRYAIEFVGNEPGTYDLAQFLRRKDRTEPGPLPRVAVVVTTSLPPDQQEPNPLPGLAPPPLGGYARLLWVLGGAWVAGLFAILLVRQSRATDLAAVAAPPSLADRLRPLVDEARRGGLAPAQLAELERLLLHAWRARLGLEETPVREAIAALRRHEQAGELLRALEQWLHQRGGPPIDAEALLRPYQDFADPDGAPRP